MYHRSSSTPSLRPSNYPQEVPFVPREVFRLVVRLEAQKALDVNVAALEQRFHVPSGYADDEGLDARGGLKGAKNFVPGPGTYEAVEYWPAKEVTALPTAGFLSATTRDPFHFQALAKATAQVPRAGSAVALSPKQRADAKRELANSELRPQTAGVAQLSPKQGLSRSPLSRPRLSDSPPKELPEQHESEDTPTSSCYSSLSSRHATVFPRVGREVKREREIVPPVGTYSVNRLWDPATPARVSMGAPSPAVFGFSREKRVVTWRPALTPPTYAVSTSWDSSRHYAKQKHKVVRSAARRRLQSARQHARTAFHPILRPSTAATAGKASGEDPTEDPPDEGPEANDDPFSWLRQRPNGEQRVNFLAAKHGLAEHVKILSRRGSDAANSDLLEADPVQALTNQRGGRGENEGGTAATSGTPAPRAKKKDSRITVSCRMPGGMLISAHMYSTRRVRHLKAALLLRQNRFQSVDEFELYHVNGKKLAAFNDTLAACGVRDRSLLQLVPTVTVLAATQAAPAPKQA